MEFVGNLLRTESVCLDVALDNVVHGLDELLVFLVQQLPLIGLVGALRRIEIIFHLLLVAY